MFLTSLFALHFGEVSGTSCCPRSCTSELLLRELSILRVQQRLQCDFNLDESNWCITFPLQYSFVYRIISVSTLVTYIMHMVHTVKSLQGPGVTSLRFTSRFKTHCAFSRAVSLSGSVPEWISIHSPGQLCPQQCPREEKQPGLPQPTGAMVWGTAVFLFCSLSRSAAALPKDVARG